MIFEGYEIQVTVRRNCRKAILRHVNGEDFFRLSVPPRIRKADVIAFLKNNLVWMQTIMQTETQTWTPAYAPGEIHYVLGQPVMLGKSGVPSGNAFLRWRTQKLADLLNRLLPVWTARMQVAVNRVTIKQTRRQWGSCSSRGNISISDRLAMYPPACTEHVLVHELCHLHHQDHSAAFYAELTALLPDWQESDRLLKTMNVKPLKGEG